MYPIELTPEQLGAAHLDGEDLANVFAGPAGVTADPDEVEA